jgi:hypothetical protein
MAENVENMADWLTSTPFGGHTGWILAVAVTPDGDEIVTAGDDGTARVWDRRSGQHRATLSGHTGWIRAVAVTPDGDEIVTAGDDGTIRVWNRVSARQVRGTDLGGVAPAIPLPGLHSDEPSVKDLLGIAGEVETLAALVAASSTEAPLAIGLLGDWGSGKSSFMRQMEQQVDELAELSANNLGQSVFVANVAQVRFNAWHYSDDHVWSGLVERLFEVLAAASGDDRAGEAHEPDPARAQQVKVRLAEAEVHYQRLDQKLRQLTGAPSVGERVAKVDSLRALGSELWRDIRSSRRSVVTWAATIIVAAAALIGVWKITAMLVPAVVTAVTLAAALLVRLGRWLSNARQRVAKVGESARAELKQRRNEARGKVAELKAELALVDTASRLNRFVTERSLSGEYAPYRGCCGMYTVTCASSPTTWPLPIASGRPPDAPGANLRWNASCCTSMTSTAARPNGWSRR